MSDEADVTQDRVESEEEARRKYRQDIPKVRGVGVCLNCGEAVAKGIRWCDRYCRDDYENRTL